ncbi:MAG: DUF4143 domain-containing protein [Spirochaetia bacterium]|jgi:predicted AAA+ superfamily ATPase|nr:DUF4143 domain-containing protein [Spirochaetia bacterium]
MLDSSDAFFNLDIAQLRAIAENDKITFFSLLQGHFPSMIDEIQKVTSLISELKARVDENPIKGQFLITGSTNIQSMPSVRESLAGRLGVVRLHTLSQGEIAGSNNNFLNCAFKEKFKTSSLSCSKQAVVKNALIGGYPEPLQMNAEERNIWFNSYISRIFQRDLKDISHITRINKLVDLVYISGLWSSKYLNTTQLAARLGISRNTLYAYFNVLQQLFLVDSVPAWTKSPYKRIGKIPKIFLTDTGLLSYLNKWDDSVIYDGDSCGKLIESFVFHELSVMVDLELNAKLYQVRDNVGHEIDFLIEQADGSLLGIEVKASETIGDKDFKSLRWFADTQVNPGTNFTGIVLYCGPYTYKKDEHLFAVSMARLWT